MPFYKEKDVDLVVEHYKDSVFLMTILHEIFGHGTGKMFRKNLDGTYNYPNNDIFCPFTGKELFNKCYEQNETYNSKFGKWATIIDECRCDAVALYLCSYFEIHEVLFANLDWDT